MDAGEVVLRQFRTRQARGCMTPLTLAIEKFIRREAVWQEHATGQLPW